MSVRQPRSSVFLRPLCRFADATATTTCSRKRTISVRGASVARQTLAASVEATRGISANVCDIQVKEAEERCSLPPSRPSQNQHPTASLDEDHEPRTELLALQIDCPSNLNRQEDQKSMTSLFFPYLFSANRPVKLIAELSQVRLYQPHTRLNQVVI